VAYYRRGLQAFEDGDMENAILDLSEAIHYDRGHAEYYSTRGLFYVEARQFEDAQVDLEYALKLNKRQWLAHYALGMIDFTNQDYESAGKHFGEASKIRPERPEVWYYLAVTDHNLGDDTQAVADMERAEQAFAPGDKRRKDATAWLKELKKTAGSAGASSPGAIAPPTGAPPLASGSRPQLKPPDMASGAPSPTRKP
jgi:tetratricopeptide (TPR) repeat protein